jgi:hypothetical protein
VPLAATKGRRRNRRAFFTRSSRCRGSSLMKSIRPDTTDPIPLRHTPPCMGSIIVRFVGLLLLAIAALAMVWLR